MRPTVLEKTDDVLARREQGQSLRKIALYTGLTKREVEGVIARSGKALGDTLEARSVSPKS